MSVAMRISEGDPPLLRHDKLTLLRNRKLTPAEIQGRLPVCISSRSNFAYLPAQFFCSTQVACGFGRVAARPCSSSQGRQIAMAVRSPFAALMATI